MYVCFLVLNDPYHWRIIRVQVSQNKEKLKCVIILSLHGHHCLYSGCSLRYFSKRSIQFDMLVCEILSKCSFRGFSKLDDYPLKTNNCE